MGARAKARSKQSKRLRRSKARSSRRDDVSGDFDEEVGLMAAGAIHPHRAESAREGPTGFPLQFDALPDTVHQVLEEFEFEALQPSSLECGGRASRSRFQGFVTRWKGSTTEADRRDLSAWLEKHGCVLEYDLGKPIPY